MILTCPECATSYFVDDLKIPRLGRMVKCTSCGARWRAYQDRSTPEAPEDDDLLVEAPPEPSPDDDDLEFVVAPVAPVRKAPKKRSRGAMIAAGVAAGLVLAGGAAVLLRVQISGIVPGAAAIFAAIGLPVNTLGLGIEGVVAKETFVAGRPVLAVTGAIRSTAEAPVMSPPIRISLLDKSGKALSSLVAEPLNAKVPPGAKRYFAVNLSNPPAGAHELEIAFDPGAGRHLAGPGKQSAPVEHAAPSAAAPAEAQPLPAGSPDALHAPAPPSAAPSAEHHE